MHASAGEAWTQEALERLIQNAGLKDSADHLREINNVAKVGSKQEEHNHRPLVRIFPKCLPNIRGIFSEGRILEWQAPLQNKIAPKIKKCQNEK